MVAMPAKFPSGASTRRIARRLFPYGWGIGYSDRMAKELLLDGSNLCAKTKPINLAEESL